MNSAPLTKRQRQILSFYQEYVSEQGMSPTLEEVANQFGITKVTIFGHVEELVRKNFLRRDRKGTSRSIQIMGPDHGTNQSSFDPNRAAGQDSFASSSPGASDRSLVLQIVGQIAAGTAIEAIEDPQDLDLSELIPDHADVYALRVKGTSMIEDAIADGDLVLVERRSQARNGETVVAALPPDGEVTLKRYYAEDGHIRLQPANSSMEPIIVEGDVEIQGVVISVIRRL
jgi:repressor LexA